MVGTRVHGVDQRDSGQAALPWPCPTPPPRGTGLLRSPGPRGPGRPSRIGPAIRAHRLLLLALLVRRPIVAGAAVRGGAPFRRARLPVLHRVGQPVVVGHLARGTEPDP